MIDIQPFVVIETSKKSNLIYFRHLTWIFFVYNKTLRILFILFYFRLGEEVGTLELGSKGHRGSMPRARFLISIFSNLCFCFFFLICGANACHKIMNSLKSSFQNQEKASLYRETFAHTPREMKVDSAVVLFVGFHYIPSFRSGL